MMKLEGRWKAGLATRWKETESLNHFVEECCILISSTCSGLHVSLRNGIYFMFLAMYYQKEMSSVNNWLVCKQK